MNWNAFEHSAPRETKAWENRSLTDAAVTHHVPVDDGLTHILTMDCACSPTREDLIVDTIVYATIVWHNAQDGRKNLA